MKMGIYAIYDSVAEECGPIWTAKNDAVAVRNCRNSLKEVRLEEYKLYALGELDSEKVLIFAYPKAREVIIPPEVAGKE